MQFFSINVWCSTKEVLNLFYPAVTKRQFLIDTSFSSSKGECDNILNQVYDIKTEHKLKILIHYH